MMTQPEVPVNTSQSNLRILWIPAFLCLILLSIEIYLLVHDWSLIGRPKTAVQTDPIAVYVSGKKIVRQKPVGTLIWEAPVPKMALFRQSEIATTDDAEAVIQFNDHSELIIEPNSLVILEEAPSGLKTGSEGKIIARLVRGSVKRKNQGVRPFFVKLSTDKDAQPIQIEDPKGGSVFRVIYRVEGYEIVVESGSVVVNQKDTVKAGEEMRQGEAPRLSAPVLKKPKVNIIRSRSQIFWNWLIPSAMATEASKISIQFSWEATPDANGYVIQVSRDPQFSEILAEKKVSGLEYDFEMEAPSKKSILYFRVAGISGNDVTGHYSAVESVEVNPDEFKPIVKTTPTPEPVIVKPTPTPKPKVVKVEPSPTPEEKPEEVYIPPAFVDTGNTLWLWYGAQFANRKFKSASNPQEVSGSGFVPAVMGFEYQHAREPGHYYSMGGSFSYESAKPDLPPPTDTKFSTSQMNLWFTYGQLFDWWKHPQTWHFGPYLSTSKKITNQGLLFQSETAFLIGAMVAIQSDPAVFKRGGDFSWRAQLAFLAVGTMGVDFTAWLRKPLPLLSDAFYGLKVNARQSGIENAFSGSLQIGFEI
jgi:hypothetical protein